MYGDIEELVLSGKLFNPTSRSSSPVRSRSPSATPARWPNDDAKYEYDSDAERQRAIKQRINAQQQQQQQESIGMGPGRTGVKGVIRDRAEAASLARSKRAYETNALNKAMEKASLGGRTWAEEERERLSEKPRVEEKAPIRKGRFGHLREVGVRSFVQAVESEDRNVWVIVHIYDPSLDRCASLDDTLSRLARLYPSTKFLRARAGALGFASTASSSRSMPASRPPFGLTRTPSRQILVPGRYRDDGDEDDPFADDEDDADADGDDDGERGTGWEDDAVDTDVLPTLLVYRGGELEHSWVRVDWEAKLGVEDLLRRHHVLSTSSVGGSGNCGLPSDDEDFVNDDLDDLVFSGSDDGF